MIPMKFSPMEVLMRKNLFLICLLGTPCASIAQSNPSSWANLSSLHAGQKIQIVETSSKKHTGTLESVSDSAISIRDSSGEASVPRQDVRTVKLMENEHQMRNLLIATGIGAGAGTGIAAAAWESNGYIKGKGTGAAVGAGLGGLAGVIAGSLWHSHKTIYTAAQQ
jgi:hypothetical protein